MRGAASAHRLHPAGWMRLRAALRRSIALWLMLSLLWAGTIGLLHGTLHALARGHDHRPTAAARLSGAVEASRAALPADAPALAAGASAPDAATSATANPPPLDALWGGHAAGDAQCQLYDQLCGGATLPSLPQLLLPPLALPMAVLQFFAGQALARWAALYDARGPPLPR